MPTYVLHATSRLRFSDVELAYPGEEKCCFFSCFEGGWHEELFEEFGEEADLASLSRWWMLKKIQDCVEEEEYENSKAILILLRAANCPFHPVTSQGAPIAVVHAPMDFSRFEGTSWAEAVHQDAAGRSREFETRMVNRGAADVPKTLSPLLTHLGVPHTVGGLEGRAHPAHKAISQHILLDKVMPNVAGDVLVVNAKKSKLVEYQKAAPKATLFLENPRFEIKDEDRYRGTAFWPGDAPLETAVLIECAQFVTPLQLGRLCAASPLLRNLYVTGIVCPETISGRSSVWPELCEYRYLDSGNAKYLLEGSSDGSYDVDVAREKEVLRPKDVVVVGPDYVVRYKYQVIHSVANHVVIQVVPVRLEQQEKLKLEVMRYSRVGWTVVPDVFVRGSLAHSNRGEMVLPTSLLMDVINYLPTLNPKTENSALHAKIDNLKKAPAYAALPQELWERLYHVGVGLRVFKFGDAGESLFEIAVWKAMLLPYLYAAGRWCFEKKWDILKACLIACLPHFAPAKWMRVGAHLAVCAKSAYDIYHGDKSATYLAIARGLAWELVPGLPTLLIECGLVVGTIVGWKLHARRAKLDLYMKMVASEYCEVFAPVSLVVLDGDFQSPTNLLEVVVGETSDDADDFKAACEQPPYESNFVPRVFEAAEINCTPEKWIELSEAKELTRVRKVRAEEAAAARALIEKREGKKPEVRFEEESDDDESVGGQTVGDGEEDEDFTVPTSKSTKTQETLGRPNAASSLPTVVESSSGAEREEVKEEREERPKEAPIEEVAEEKESPIISEDDDGEPIRAPVMPRNETDSPAPSVIASDYDGEYNAGSAPIPDDMVVESEQTAFSSERSRDTVSHIVGEEAIDVQNSIDFDGEYGHVTPLKEDLGKAISIPVLFGAPAKDFVNASAHWCVLEQGALGEVEYVGQCSVRAFAVLVRRAPEAVWAELSDCVPEKVLIDWTAEGAPRVIFEILGYLHRVKLDLLGANGLKKQTFGHSAGRLVGSLKYDRENQHYVVSATEAFEYKRKLMDRAKPRAVSAETDSMLVDLDRFKDEHGERIPGRWEDYQAEPKRAAQFLKELADGRIGLLKKLEGERFVKGLAQKLERACKQSAPRVARVRLVTGYNGCSKTHPIGAFLATRGKDAKAGRFMTVAPRVPIREDLYAKIGPRGEPSRHNTFENALTRFADLVLIDELALFPPGYLDAMILLQTGRFFYVCQDPSQCLYNNPNPQSKLNELVPEGLHVARRLKGDYWLWSHRVPQLLAVASGVPSSNPQRGFVKRIVGAFQDVPMICSTTAKTMQKRSEKYSAFSCSGIQGREYPYVQFLLDSIMLSGVSARDIWTACCRVTKGIYLITADSSATMAAINSHPIFGALFAAQDRGVQGFSYEKLAGDSLHGLTIIRRDDAIRETRRIRFLALTQEDKGKSAELPVYIERMGPKQRCLYDSIALKDFGESLTAEVDGLHEPEHIRSLPIISKEVLKAMITPEFASRTEREFINHVGMSKLYDDVMVPEEDVYLFPRMKTNDAAFVVATFKKRIERGSISTNERAFVKGAEVGARLFDHAHRALGLPPILTFDEDLWYESLDAQIQARVVDRSAGLIAQYEERSDAWLNDFGAKVRVKGQLKAKLEALALTEPKAGQTINVLPEWVIATYGVWCRYIMACIKKNQSNSHLHIFGGESLSAFNDRVKENWQTDPNLTDDEMKFCTINDFTAFGSSQGGESVTMDLAWFRWVSMPEVLESVYVRLKTSLIALGHIKKTCRDDGEPGTYLFNCLYDIANNAMKFGVAAMWRGYWLIGGDDMAVDHSVPEHPQWSKKWRATIKTISKLQYVEEADFCGWILQKHFGIIRDPMVIYLKIRARDAHGYQRSDYLPGYAAELRFTYHAIRAGATLSDLSLAVLQNTISTIHSSFPVLASLNFAAGSLKSRLTVLRERIEYWSGHSFHGRKAVLRVARAALAREERGFRVDMPALTSGSGFIVSNNHPSITFKCLSMQFLLLLWLLWFLTLGLLWFLILANPGIKMKEPSRSRWVNLRSPLQTQTRRSKSLLRAKRSTRPNKLRRSSSTLHVRMSKRYAMSSSSARCSLTVKSLSRPLWSQLRTRPRVRRTISSTLPRFTRSSWLRSPLGGCRRVTRATSRLLLARKESASSLSLSQLSGDTPYSMLAWISSSVTRRRRRSA
nr:hypothetical protein [Armillaria spp. tymovirus]